MPPFKQPPKRRKSGSGRSSYRVHNRPATQSASRQSSTRSSSLTPNLSCRPSTESLPGEEHRQSPTRSPSRQSHRPQSGASSRTYGGSQSQTAPEKAQGDCDTDLDWLEEIVMAVNLTDRGTVGCAYYAARTETLYFMEDVKLEGPDVIDALKLFIEPTVVLVSTKCDDAVLSRLDPEMKDARASPDGRTGDRIGLPYLLECRPNAEFGYDSARNKLVNLRIGQQDGPDVTFVVPGDVLTHGGGDYGGGQETSLAGRYGQLLKLAGWINMESRVTVGCAGAVLSYLQRRRTAAYLPGDQASAAMFRIATVEMFSLTGSMFVNADTLMSLQITSTESHPNAQNQGPSSRAWSSGGAKEGLSVYGLFHHFAKTTQGRSLLRQYFLRPSLNLEVINERLDTIATLLRPDNSTTLEQIVGHLAKTKNMRVILVNLRKGISVGQNRGVSNSIWPAIRDFVFFALRVSDCVSELNGAERLAIRVKIAEKFDKRGLAAIGKLICDTVDFEASKEQHRTTIRTGVDQDLDETKRTFDGIEDLLSQVTEHVADQVPAALNAQINVIFFPQIGFLIACRKDEETGSAVYDGPAHDPWERMFVTATAAYYKNANTSEMDEHFGDIHGHICDREIEIAQQLGVQVLEYEKLLNEVSDICGELDSLVALAKGAMHHNLVRPHMTKQNIIKIRGGRHLLQELTVPSYVANDTWIIGGNGQDLIDPAMDARFSQEELSENFQSEADSAEAPSMVLMTGPNYSGKSVYLKQVAIIVYMAHIGSFVPAEAAKIGLTDKILTRISTRESVSRIQSAFMIDLQQISVALNQATPRSLLIIDEFGKGTESYDGAGLAAGVFEHLLRSGNDCPKVLGATHFHEIFESGFLPARPTLGFAHMEVKIDTNASQVDDQITYLYNYQAERSNSSFGTSCAAMNGIDRKVIEKAEELILLAARGENLIEACAEMPQAELAELEDAEAIARDFLAANIDHCEPRQLLDDLMTLASSSVGQS